MKVMIRAGWIIDGTGSPVIRNGYVLFDGDRIIKVGGTDTEAPSDAKVIELPDHTILPGLIDVHSHVSIHTLGNEHGQVGRREAAVALDAAKWLKEDLHSGVTTMRTLGDPDFLDVLFRQAQREGTIEAPRLQVAGNLIQSSHVNVSVSKSTCNGFDAIRQAARESVRAGCDWIKFYSTPASRTPNPILPIFSRSEVELIFDEARRAGRPVSAHCHGGDAADWCIELNVDSLEHGLFLTESQMEAIARKSITLVPTTGVILLQQPATPSVELDRACERANSFLDIARKHGVRCVPGTDAVHGQIAFEAEKLAAHGWSNCEAIAAIAGDAAELLGLQDSLGSLAPGKIADIVAVKGNVSEDIKKLRSVDLVIQSGAFRFDQTTRQNC